MRLHDYKYSNRNEFKNFLIKELDLSVYQQDKLKTNDIIFDSKYTVMEKTGKVNSNALWRLSILLYPIYIVLLFLYCIVKYVFTGKFAIGSERLLNIHTTWNKKIGI